MADGGADTGAGGGCGGEGAPAGPPGAYEATMEALAHLEAADRAWAEVRRAYAGASGADLLDAVRSLIVGAAAAAAALGPGGGADRPAVVVTLKWGAVCESHGEACSTSLDKRVPDMGAAILALAGAAG